MQAFFAEPDNRNVIPIIKILDIYHVIILVQINRTYLKIILS